MPNATTASKPKGKKGATETASKDIETKEDAMTQDQETAASVDSEAVTTNVAAKTTPVEIQSESKGAAESKSSEILEANKDEDDDEEEDEDDEEEDDDTEEDDEDIQDAGEIQDENDGILRIPENEFAFLTEILKNPIGDNQYEISREAPKAAFKGRGSPKTLAQTAKNKLMERGIIKSIQAGGAQRRAIVELLIENVEMSKEGRGRKINTVNTGTGRKPGRPKGSVSTNRTERTERTERGRDESVASGGSGAESVRRPGRQSTIKGVITELRGPDYEDLNEFEMELDKFAQRFPNTFSKFVKVLRRHAA